MIKYSQKQVQIALSFVEAAGLETILKGASGKILLSGLRSCYITQNDLNKADENYKQFISNLSQSDFL